MPRPTVAIALCLLLQAAAALFSPQSAPAQDKPWLPPDLAPWAGWTLYRQDAAQCPPQALDPAQRQCAYPTRLKLAVAADGATFKQNFRVFAPQTVPLPWAQGLWPAAVTLGGKPAAVLDMNGRPGLRLQPGEWQVEGQLPWKRKPQAVRIAAQTGLIELTVDGKPVENPRLTPDGALDVSGADTAKAQADALGVTVMRLLRDGQPMTLTTLARLEVSGRSRTMTLDGLLLPGSEPLGVNSPIPVGFGPDGKVLVQAGAGRYDVEIVSRLPGGIMSVGPVAAPFGRETWAFQADKALREVKLSGPPSTDPQTSDLPQDWKRFPAYVLEKGATVALQLVRRGESLPPGDDLKVGRELWLDFDGKGLTAQDTISGPLRRSPVLAMREPGELGRVSSGGRDLPVVLLGPEKRRGVELRQSPLAVTAEARYPDASIAIPATGWEAGVSSLSAVLHLPPGWTLLDASGPDALSESWAGKWNLLDIFITMLAALGAWKLRGVAAGAALLAFLLLAQHEPGAPVDTWLVLLAVLGVSRAFESSSKAGDWPRVAGALRILRAGAVLALCLAALAFAADQIRLGLHPQFTPSFFSPGPASVKRVEMSPMQATDEMEAQEASPVPRPQAAPPVSPSVSMERLAKEKAPRTQAEGGAVFLGSDPSSLVQTGPGIPAWRWHSVRLTWNGPVDANQTLRLMLMPPAGNTALCFVRVALLLAGIWLVAGGMIGSTLRAGKSVAAVLLCLAALASAGAAQAGEAPPKEVLDELRTRLLAPAECFPTCAGVSSMAVNLDAKGLTLTLEAGAATQLAMPLPVVSGWRPASLSADGKPVPLYATEAGLWALLEEGAHKVVMSGPVPADVAVTISAPLQPRTCRVEAPGWAVLGIDQDGVFQGSLRLTRQGEAGRKEQASLTPVYPPFLEVRRTLELGLAWQARTTVRRMTPADQPVLVHVGLMPGESVLEGGVPVENGKAVVSLAAGRQELSWRSRLDISPEVTLEAPTDAPWVETWRLRASPVWDVALSGIPVTASQDESGAWSPMWRPWPGEKASIKLTRPEAAPGESLTIDRVRLRSALGARQDEVRLMLHLRSSLGGRHTLALPADAQLTGLQIGGQPAPWSSDKPGEVGIALSPGVQEVTVNWRQPRDGFFAGASPTVDVGHPAVNAEVTLDLPRDRWVLWVSGATPMGPAVVFWGTLCVVLIVAALFSRLPWTPLGFAQWMLLGLGLVQPGGVVALGAAAWLVALGLRRNYQIREGWFAFNAVQVLLVCLVLAGLSCLFEAVRDGLLGAAVGMVQGNGSNPHHLVWLFDRTPSALPVAKVWSVSVWWYRGLMLAWSLWLAFSLVGWLRWAWDSFCVGGAWRKPDLKLKPLKPLAPSKGGKPEEPAAAAEAGQGGQEGQPAPTEEGGKGGGA
ncbi:hypothetical protein [Fundidesulfovibrio agrisoli]|uniref:hypothetical protein n=1 Tax=Fundidesulfovibrio agrisoli TaxID=2922717 RepID=UPI001FABE390|nr:hypothetical protein [Fundidesulfovibrio agrisoli]